MKLKRQLSGRLGGTRAVLAAALVASVAGIAVSGTANASGAKPPIVVGGILPFTGTKSLLSNWGVHGTGVGIYEVNQAGGVLGQRLTSKFVDDAADSVDTLPAFRRLMLSHPKFIVGPFSPTIEAVINQFQPNNVVDMMIGGLFSLDNMNKPFVFRTTASDTTEAVAMARYAINKGYRSASMIFDNSANSQGFVPPLIKAYKALGGHIQQNLTITPGQSSYSSELTQAFAGKPQVVFSSFDTQTAATLWSDGQQLGYMSTPWIGDDLQSGAAYAKSFGPTVFKELTAALPASPSGAAYNHFLLDYKRLYHTNQPLPTAENFYDAVVIPALAMTMAKSTNPRVWVKDVVKVSNPPGVQCFTYASCVNLIKRGKKINYQGAGGSDDFNVHHNVFSGFDMVGFNTSYANVTRTYVSPAALAMVVAKER